MKNSNKKETSISYAELLEEIIKQLESVPSKNGYIINLIKEDIANKKAFDEIKEEYETLKKAYK